MGFSLTLSRSGIETLTAHKGKQTAARMTEPNRLDTQVGAIPYHVVAAHPAHTAPTEAALIELSKAGDQQAFGTLIELHQDRVYNLAYRILQNAEEADDATQETFLKAWQALPTFRGDAKFSTWLYRVTHNHCLNRLRSARSNPKTVSVEWFSGEDNEEHDILANLSGNESDLPSIQYEGREQRDIIWSQVDALPARYRAIIVLYYSDELSYEEIAAALNIPVGTVKTHLYRAKGLLKTRLGELHQKGVLS
ncbi:sigma-70 family RNA polymerase sigma factor [Candidatus Chlorohelix sp.]|uniref:RNA polymerase sigma factor n=1 Tax=Candidatus Chlorohelix sp. TaxID=3139201 RepID=UPI0030217E9C